MKPGANPTALKIGQWSIANRGGVIPAMRALPHEPEIILAALLLAVDLNLPHEDLRRQILELANEMDKIAIQQIHGQRNPVETA